ncbi:hypothetical protein [Natrarchaeobius oligotrophus]|uniref:Uncharacterized protein n=1 Tax=Natrarchaeobius chitinivorans TaxID=1679083 RepID=A0A3N6PUI7_NATCH|nr:hypothetical protein [Natrarchaeobius chitinivorans]RQH03446.1 hypothetical protein EA472_02505 [Natrarchaeobius chitinivorans]
MAVTLPDSLLTRYARFSLYNSPYAAHDDGCAVDLYPGTLADGRTTDALSPVGGVVRERHVVRAPAKPYAPVHDVVLALECDDPPELEGLVARVLHVDPSVEVGERVERGESLGSLLRAGFFAPWVDNHLHVGFRRPDQNIRRASGSLALALESEVRPLEWDGTGTVVSTDETYAVLDAPSHPNPGEEFVGLGVERRIDGSQPVRGVLDGGLPHYDGGGVYVTGGKRALEGAASVHLNGVRLGSVSRVDGRTVDWDDAVVTVDGEPVTGLSAFCARDGDFGAKLVCPDREFAVGERVRVRVRRRP